MKTGDYIRVTKDILPILKSGALGVVRQNWLPKIEGLPASWEVYFQRDDSTHYIYEDEMEVLGLRVGR
jgi:hypothetical protein